MLEHLNILTRPLMPLFICLSFLAVIATACCNRNDIKQFFSAIDKKTWLFLGLVFLVALLIRLVIPARQYILYCDEAYYMEGAKSLLQTGFQGDYPKSIGWPFLLALVFAVFGVTNTAAFYFSIVFGALTAGAIFLMTFAITQKKGMSLFAAIIFSLFPAHIRWSASIETNVASLFFIILTVCSFFLYYRLGKRPLLWLVLSFLAFTVQFRSENYSLPFLFLAGCFIFGRQPFKKADSIPILASILLFMPNCFQTFVFYMKENWPHNIGLNAAGGSFSHLSYAFLYFARFIVNADFQPLLLSIFIVLGAAHMFFKKRKEWCFLLIWFFLFSLFYFFLASFQAIGARGDTLNKTRFFMMFYPITVVFASYGIAFLQERFKGGLAKKGVIIFSTALLCLFFIPYTLNASYWFRDSIRSLDVAIPSLIKENIPKDCVIVCHWPSLLRATTDYEVIDLADFLDDEALQEQIMKPGRCVLFFENSVSFFSNYSLEKRMCEDVKHNFLLKPYRVYGNKDVRFTFYEILRPKKEAGFTR